MKRLKPLLGPLQKRTLYLTITLLWLSGAIWLRLPAGHASGPLWMKIHGAAAMAFLIVFGTLLHDHVPTGWQQKRERRSGGSLLGICVVLILTGWLLYYAGSEGLRHWASVIHWVLGLLIPVVIFLHVRLGSASEVI
jgi:hypothetical protein